VESALRGRYGRRVETQLADVQLKLAPGHAHLAACSALNREEHGATFVIAKVGGGRSRTMSFYPSPGSPASAVVCCSCPIVGGFSPFHLDFVRYVLRACSSRSPRPCPPVPDYSVAGYNPTSHFLGGASRNVEPGE